MKRSTVFLAVLAALAFASAPAHAAKDLDPAALVAAKRQLQSGVTTAKSDVILQARAAFLALASDHPAPWLDYWVALCCWRAEPMVMQSDAEQAKKLCRDGIDAADHAIAGLPKSGAPVALKAGLQGLSLSFDPAMGMTLGPV